MVSLYYYFSDSGDKSCTGRKQRKKTEGAQNNPIPVISAVPGPSNALTECEQLSQLMEIFPASSAVDLRTSLALLGTVARAALSMSTSGTNDDSDDSDLAQPAYPPRDIDSNQSSLHSFLEELTHNLSSE